MRIYENYIVKISSMYAFKEQHIIKCILFYFYKIRYPSINFVALGGFDCEEWIPPENVYLKTNSYFILISLICKSKFSARIQATTSENSEESSYKNCKESINPLKSSYHQLVLIEWSLNSLYNISTKRLGFYCIRI